MIGIINYGLGNIAAFHNVYKGLSIPHKICNQESDMDGINKIIIPGVGAFDYAMELLNNSGMRMRLDELVVKQSVPVLGICVGMQILASSSEEGTQPGLGWIEGKVLEFRRSQIPHQAPLPHMGWNSIHPREGHPLFHGLDAKKRFYFLHSFYFGCADDQSVIASAEYGERFSCAVSDNNVYGVQFHPEKSHHNGTQLLKNFAAI